MKRLLLIFVIIIIVLFNSCYDEKETSKDKVISNEEHINLYQSKIDVVNTVNINMDDIDMTEKSVCPFNESGWIASEFPKSIQDSEKTKIYNISDIIEDTDDMTIANIIEDKIYKFLEMDFGLILGYDGGELGGYLSYIQPEIYDISCYDSYLINTYIIKDIFKYNDSVYYISSLPFGNGGGVGKLELKDNIWSDILFIDVNSAVYGYVIDNEKLYVLTKNRLLLIENDVIEKTLITSEFINTIYPISMIKVKDIIYIGGRGGVISYDITNEELLWWEKQE